MNNGDISNTTLQKLTDNDKLIEYFNLLINDDNFEIKTEEQEISWSNGKKIGTFFSEHHKEIIERFFDDSQKDKIKTFKARAKIIDYMMSIGGKKTKKIEESYDRVLAYLNDYSNIEDIIRCVSVSMSSDGAEKYKSAMVTYMEAYNYDEDTSENYLEVYVNNAGMSFAMSSEKIFKSLIIFSECLKSRKYTYAPRNYSDVVSNNNGDKNLIIGTSKWRKELNKKGAYGAIRSEESLLELIKENIPLPTLDKRVNIKSVKSTSGHDLYSLYQLLDPVSKLIVNSEFYIYDPNNPDNRNKGIGMYAVLTQNLNYQQAGTEDVVQNLEEYSDDFVKSRYADIDLNNVKLDELDFLKRIATALKDYCTYKFPIGKKYDKMDFLSVDMSYLDSTIDVKNENGIYTVARYPYFSKLDKVSKYYLLSNFDKNEIEQLNNYLEKLQKSNFDYIQVEQYLNLTIFFKQFVVEKLKMHLSFEKTVLYNLTRYFNNIKDFDLFNGVSNNLFLSSFFTRENVERLQKEIESKKIFNIEKNTDLSKKVSKERLKNIAGFKKLELCRNYRIECGGPVLLRNAVEINEIMKICRNNGIKCEGPVLLRSASEIKEIMEICRNYGIKPTTSIFRLSPNNLCEKLELCRNYGIKCEELNNKNKFDELDDDNDKLKRR